MDKEHMKFVLATGFQHFWRGRAQKERMSVHAFLFSLGIYLNFREGSSSSAREYSTGTTR